MRKVLRAAPAIALAAVLSGQHSNVARAQLYGSDNYIYNTQSFTHGLNLPQVPLPSGSDEIRAADGTTCKSSMAANDAYLDVGGIGSQGAGGTFDSGSVYARVVVPLGEKPRRLDCTSLYQLEIQRLQSELQLVRMGLAGGGAGMQPTAGTAKSGDWSEKGWSTKGWKDPNAKLGGPQVAAPAAIAPEPVAPRMKAPAAASPSDTAQGPRTFGWTNVDVIVEPAMSKVVAADETAGQWRTTVIMEVD